MTYISNKDFLVEVSKGNVAKHSTIHKFGYATVATSLVPVNTSLTYPTPTSATALEVVSASANDTSAGTGARQVTIVGLDGSGNIQTEDVTMNGTSAVALSNSYLRVYDFFVKNSGTYASSTASSNAGVITLQGSGGGAAWAKIDVVSSFGLGQSMISCYTVPAGYTAYVLGYDVLVEDAKAVDVYLFKREGITTTSAPYTPMQLVDRYKSAGGEITIRPKGVITKLEALTDYGYMGVVASGTAGITVNTDILLIQD